jgi:lipopolysaccharide/colanic/teichoic acid biosynthesis glycosyltransferase
MGRGGPSKRRQTWRRRSTAGIFHGLFHRGVAGVLLLLLVPVLTLIIAAICLDSPGSPIFSCERVGYRGRRFGMLKFRKMRRDAAGGPLTAPDDPRLTRVGRVLARTKLDELPQLWNVVCGEMNLVGPRPEDPRILAVAGETDGVVGSVRPGITGLSQLAYRREADVLDPAHPLDDYLRRVLPQKLALDELYASHQSIAGDLSILLWTAVATVTGRDVAVDRRTGALTVRQARRASHLVGELAPALEQAAE